MLSVENFVQILYDKYMAYRKLIISRQRLIAAYYKDGIKQPLRAVAEELGIAHNSVRNWLIRFGLYDSRCDGRINNPKGRQTTDQ